MAEKSELKQRLSSKEAELTRAQETIRREQQQNRVMREKVQEMEQEMEEMKLKIEEMEKQVLEYIHYGYVYIYMETPLAIVTRNIKYSRAEESLGTRLIRTIMWSRIEYVVQDLLGD